MEYQEHSSVKLSSIGLAAFQAGQGVQQTPSFVLPDIVEQQKNDPIFALFEIGEGHQKQPIKLTNGNRQSADPDKGELWTWDQVCEYKRENTAFALSIPAFEKYSGKTLIVRDLDEYKPDYDKERGEALLQWAAEYRTHVSTSFSGKGKHVWQFTTEPLLHGGANLQSQRSKAIDVPRTYLVLSGKPLQNEPVLELRLTCEEREAIQAAEQHRSAPLALLNQDGSLSPIAAANLQLDLEDELTALGFTTRDGKRWKSPDSETTAGGFVVPSHNGPFDVFVTYNETGLDWMQTAKSGRVADAAHLRMHRLIAEGQAKSAKDALRILAQTTIAINEHGEVLAESVHLFNNPPLDPASIAQNEEGQTDVDEPWRIPEEVLRPDDMFGELVQLVYISSRRPNLLSAFVAVTSFLMTLGGGHYRGIDDDDRLRLNFIIPGGSGSGKELAETGGTALASNLVYKSRTYPEDARVPELFVNRFRRPAGSAEGLEDALLEEPDLLIQWGEIAEHLNQMENGKAYNKSGYLNLLVDLYSKADKPYVTRDLAKNKGTMIYAPHPMFVATSTEEKLVDVLSENFLTDGTGARIAMFNADPYREPNRRRPAGVDLPEHIVTVLGRIYNKSVKGRAPQDRFQNPIKIPFEEAADDLFYEAMRAADELPPDSLESALMNRRAVHAKSFALARGLLAGQVTEEIARWSLTIVEHSDQYKLHLAKNRVSFGAADKARLAVVEKLKKAGTDKSGQYKWETRRVLSQLSQMRKAAKENSNGIDAVLTSLVKDGIVEYREELRPGGIGQSSKFYRYIPEN